MKKISILTLFLSLWLASCQKGIDVPECAKCLLLSDKYTAELSWIKRDTLWMDNNVCGVELDKVKNAPAVEWLDWTDCPPPVPSMPEFRIEKRSYVIEYWIN